MNVVLVNPLSAKDRTSISRPRIPYGIVNIASVCEKEGYNISIWDRNANFENIETVLKNTRPDIIGISAMTGPCLNDAMEISKKCKDLFPAAPVVWGGIHPTLLPEQTIAEKYIDCVVTGDGEYTMLNLVKAVERQASFDRIHGIYYKIDGKILKTPPCPLIKNIDELPFPAWHLIEMKKYIGMYYGGSATLNTSRGCPFNCAFCSEPVFSNRLWRGHSSQRIFNMIEHLHYEYNINYIIFRESMFLANLERVEEFCDLLIDKNLKVKWHCPARIKNWDVNLLKKMKKSGCEALEFGVESGSPRILKLLNKNITIEQVDDTFKKCNKVGITPQINLMCGIPTETKEDFKMTMNLLGRLEHGPVDLMTYVPYPGTRLYNYVVDQGLFHPPENLQGWTTISDLHGFDYSFGEVNKKTLWDAKLMTLKLNRTLWRKKIFLTLLRHPGRIFNLRFPHSAFRRIFNKKNVTQKTNLRR